MNRLFEFLLRPFLSCQATWQTIDIVCKSHTICWPTLLQTKAMRVVTRLLRTRGLDYPRVARQLGGIRQASTSPATQNAASKIFVYLAAGIVAGGAIGISVLGSTSDGASRTPRWQSVNHNHRGLSRKYADQKTMLKVCLQTTMDVIK